MSFEPCLLLLFSCRTQVFWVNEEVLKSWVEEEKTGKQGASPKYSDQAIITMMTIKRVMGLARRQTEGFVESLFMLMGVD